MTGLSSELIFENARQSIQIWIDLHHFPVEQIGSKLSLFRLSRHYDDLGCAQSMPPDLAVLGTRRFTAHPIRASRPPSGASWAAGVSCDLGKPLRAAGRR